MIGNPCSGKTEFANFALDYFSNNYNSIDDYNCLDDVFSLDDAIRSSTDSYTLLKDFELSGKANTIVRHYLDLYGKGEFSPSSLHTSPNCHGGHDILKPELWDSILVETLSKVKARESYIIEFSRGADKDYMQYRSISELEIYDIAFSIVAEQLKGRANEILIVNLNANYEIRNKRNRKI